MAVLSVVLAAWACSRVDAAGTDVSAESRAAVGETSDQGARAARIVSAGGNVTETLYALGLGSSIVAVDTTSVFPEAATRLPQVGYLRRLSGEGILSLSPTLFIGTDDAQPKSVLGQLASARVPVELVTNAPGPDAAYERVRQIGRAVSRERQAQALVAGMQAELGELRRVLAAVQHKPSVLFIYARGQGSAQVAGRGTSAQMMIELSGGQNAIDQFEGFRPLTAEAALMADPDFLLMPDKGLDSLDGVDGLLRQPGIAHTRAGRERRIIAVDDSRLLGFGPRVAIGVRELARQLHPDLPGLAP